jgi:hypothetical protein
MDQIGIGCNFSPSFQKEGKDIRSPTGKPDVEKIEPSPFLLEGK